MLSPTGSSYYAVSTVEDMMNELVTNGPITVGYAIYADFLKYKSGKNMLMSMLMSNNL